MQNTKGFTGSARVNLWDGGSKRIMDISIGDKITGVFPNGELVPSAVLSIQKQEKNNQWIDLKFETKALVEKGSVLFIRCTGNQKLFSADLLDYKEAEQFIFTPYVKENVSFLFEKETLVSHLQPYTELIKMLALPIYEKNSCNFENAVYNLETETGNFFVEQIQVSDFNA